MTADFGVDVDRDRLAAVCRRYGISSLSVFGSVARGAGTSSSDLDLLYELRPGARLGWEIDDLADELSEIFGRPVDLVSRVGLHPLLADAIFGEARPLFLALLRVGFFLCVGGCVCGAHQSGASSFLCVGCGLCLGGVGGRGGGGRGWGWWSCFAR